MSSSLPSKAEVRNEDGSINWEVVDPHLRRDRGRGWIMGLSRELGISYATLLKRKRQIGDRCNSPGRPSVSKLTEREQLVMSLRIDKGKLYREIAAELGSTPDSVSRAMRRAVEKLTLAQELGCETCMGAGVVPCKDHGCGSNAGTSGGQHAHVCLSCGAKSTYAASVGIKAR